MITAKIENTQRLKLDRGLRRTGVKSVDFIKHKALQNFIIFGALMLLVVIFELFNPSFLDKYNLVSMSQSLAPFAILGIGVTFVIATGGIDLSIGTVCIASAVIAGKLYMDGMPLVLTLPIMIIIGTIFGLINGFLIAKLKLPAFIATLGTMLFARGLSALIVKIPNIFYPNDPWFKMIFSNLNDFPIAFVWVILFMLIGMYFMFKNKIGRYILAIGSNEEATRLSGIDTDKYKILAYTICGLCAGIAAIFWSASFPTVSSASGNGMELDAIAGVYIGGTSATGGVASMFGTVVGSMLLVVIRSGLNFLLSMFKLDLNAQYVTFVLTGIIVVGAVIMDVIKSKKAGKVKIRLASKNLKINVRDEIESLKKELDILLSSHKNTNSLQQKIDKLQQRILEIKKQGKGADYSENAKNKIVANNESIQECQKELEILSYSLIKDKKHDQQVKQFTKRIVVLTEENRQLGLTILEKLEIQLQDLQIAVILNQEVEENIDTINKEIDQLKVDRDKRLILLYEQESKDRENDKKYKQEIKNNAIVESEKRRQEQKLDKLKIKKDRLRLIQENRIALDEARKAINK